ncbi:MAG: response regulator [bacterium]
MTTVLYVDDEETIGRVVSRFFERRGDRVLIARTIAEARGILGGEEPDAIFIDMRLGAESGVDLMDWIVREQPGCVEKVTFVTGDLAVGLAAGSCRGRPVIQKPFELAQLVHVVERAEPRAGT